MFVLKDIYTISGLKNPSETLRNIPDKWHSSVSLKGGKSTGIQTTNVVNEAGLYKNMRSNKHIAQPFQEFVCEEILPSIRKTGEYKYQKIRVYINWLRERSVKNIEQDRVCIL